MNVIGTVLSCKRKKRSAKGANANVYRVRLEIGDNTTALAYDIPANRVKYRSSETLTAATNQDGNTRCAPTAPETKTDESTDTHRLNLMEISPLHQRALGRKAQWKQSQTTLLRLVVIPPSPKGQPRL
jgi:hypothetical protein